MLYIIQEYIDGIDLLDYFNKIVNLNPIKK